MTSTKHSVRMCLTNRNKNKGGVSMNNLNMDERTKNIVDDAVDAVKLFGTLGDKEKECLLIFLKGWDARKNMEELLNDKSA